MNREIKFRCWNTGNRFVKRMFSWEEMIDTLQSEINPNKSLFAPFIQSDQSKKNPCMVLMQYTGFEDKNGKEIYEGDVIIKNKILCRVIWSTKLGKWGVRYRNIWAEGKSKHFYKSMPWASDGKIIGNIYENDELLNT